MAGWVSDVSKFVNDLQAVITRTREGQFAPFYFLHGQDKVSYFSMLLANIIEENAVLPEHRYWNFYKVILSSSERLESDIYAIGGAAPRGGAPRTLISVREAENVKDWGTLLPLFERVNPTAVIVLQFGTEVDAKELKKNLELKKIMDIVAKSGELFSFQMIYESRGDRVIEFIAKQYNLTIASNAIFRLKTLYGANWMLIDNEIRKIASIIPEEAEQQITLQVLEGSKANKTYTLSDLTKLLLSKDITKVIPILENLTTGADAIALELVVATLYRYFRTTFLYGVLKRKMDNDEIFQRMGIPQSQQQEYIIASKTFDPSRCAKIFELLRDFDQKIKTGVISRDKSTNQEFEAVKQLLLQIFA